MFDVPTLLSIITLALVCVTWITDFFQWRSIRQVNSFLDNSRDVGEQFGDWLLTEQESKTAEGETYKVSNMQLLCHQAGHSIAQYFSQASKGIASGDARLYRSVEKKMIEAMQTPESKAILKLCETIDLDPQYADVALAVANRLGFDLGSLSKNNGSSSGWRM